MRSGREQPVVGGSWHGSCSPRHMREGALDQLRAGQLPRPQGIRLDVWPWLRIAMGAPRARPPIPTYVPGSPQATAPTSNSPATAAAATAAAVTATQEQGRGRGKVSRCSRATAAVRVRRRPRTRNEGSCLPQGEAGCLSESERRASKVITPTTACRSCGTQQRRLHSDPTEEEETPDPPRLWRAAGHSLQA